MTLFDHAAARPGGYEGRKEAKMDKKYFDRHDELISRLDNLEGCEDNPVYREEIKEIRRELADIETAIEATAAP